MGARLVAVATGVWLMFSPAAFDYVDTVPGASDRIAGPVAAALSFVAIWGVARALRWTTLPIGLYLIMAPWILGFPTDAAVSNIAAGVILVVTAFVRGGVAERYGGGWMSLRHPCPGVDLPARG